MTATGSLRASHVRTTDALITTFYNHAAPGEGLIAIQSPTGGPAEYVRIEGNDHYGGVTVDGENVYVSGNGKTETFSDDWLGIDDGSHIQQYRLTDLVDGASEDADGEPVAPVDTIAAPTGSTVTSHDGTLYAAQHRGGVRGDLYSWSIGPDGTLTPDRSGEPVGQVPSDTQGMVTDGERWFAVTTTPDGDRLARESNSQIREFDPETGRRTNVVTDSASPLSQGVDIIDGQLVLTNEGYSDPYRDDGQEAGVYPNPYLQAYDIPRGSGTKGPGWAFLP